LSHDEFLFINLISIAYKDLYGISKAIEIWQKLKTNYEKNYMATVGENIAYRDLLVNIAIALKQSERFEECLSLVEDGMAIALKYHDMRSYSRYLYQKAWCLLKLGNKKEGEELYKKFLMFAYTLDGYANISFETVKKEYEDVFGGKLDLSISW
jgi:tetratricopeptide (TPR) repeat protein